MIDIANYFTAQAQSGQFQLLFVLIAFLGGVLASVSPCSLAMLPVIIGYIGGYGDDDNKVVFGQLMSFVFGSAVVFSIIGVICALTGKVFSSVGGDYFVLVLGSVMVALGLNIMGVIELNFPTLVNKVPQNRNNSKYIYPMLLGIVFAIAGTPCSTPILAGIMSFAVITRSILLSVIMLFAFALGQGVILVVAGMFTGLMKRFGKIASVSEVVMKLSGILLVVAGLYLFHRVFMQFI